MLSNLTIKISISFYYQLQNDVLFYIYSFYVIHFYLPISYKHSSFMGTFDFNLAVHNY